MISPDVPITKVADDTLNRGVFAQSLATTILQYSFPSSFSIGLYGAWGSGKTSLLNMELEAVEENDEDAVILRFNPWLCADSKQLITQFFKQLSTAIKLKKSAEAKAWEIIDRYADLFAIGTVADVVSLTDENRIIVNRGTDVISNTKREGLKALMNIAGIANRNIKAEDIAFGIAPRLNAAGRMGSAETALKLLLTTNKEEAEEYAKILNGENEKRKKIEADIFEQALSQINEDANFTLKKVIVVCGTGWHHGVIGIVASKLTERFYKPCIVLSEENGVCKGSARSISAFNLFNALEYCEKLLTTFGGHSGAAGLTLGKENVEKFETEINKYANTVLTDEDMIPVVDIECELAPKSATMELVKRIESFEPFGEENEPPVFSMKEAEVIYISKVGKDMTHLRMIVSKDSHSFNTIGFGMGMYGDYISKGDCVDIAFGIGINSYNGQENIQFYLKDIKTGKDC